MAVVRIVLVSVIFSFMGATAGFLLGEYAPDGLAAMGQPFSDIRDAAATHYAAIGAIVGLVVGLILGSRIPTRSSAADRLVTESLAPNERHASQPATGGDTRDRPRASWLSVDKVILGFVGALILGPVAVSIIRDRARRSSTSSSPSPNTNSAPASGGEGAPPTVAYPALFDAYAGDAALAAQRYGRGRLRFVTFVGGSTRTSDGGVVVVGWERKEKVAVLAWRSRNAHEVDEIHVGDVIRPICHVDGMAETYLRMSDCELSQDPSPPNGKKQ